GNCKNNPNSRYSDRKTVKHYGLGPNDLVVTVATDGLDRYGSVMNDMRRDYGVVDRTEAVARVRSLFHAKTTDHVWDGTAENRRRWHNLSITPGSSSRGEASRSWTRNLTRRGGKSISSG